MSHKKIKSIKKRKKINFKYKPILLGGLHNLQGITAPAFVKSKLKHMINDSDLIAKKNVWSQDEFKKKSADLRKKVVEYQSSRKAKADDLNKKRVTATQSLFKKINPILATYTKENNISLILDKRNVVIGNTALDITDIIVDLLNKSNPNISLT